MTAVVRDLEIPPVEPVSSHRFAVLKIYTPLHRQGTGEVIGIVGRSGSGKSTLTKLIQRLYIPESGRVLIDQFDLATIDPPSPASANCAVVSAGNRTEDPPLVQVLSTRRHVYYPAVSAGARASTCPCSVSTLT